MPFNGQGVFEPLEPPDFPAIPGDTILAARFNAVILDLLSGLSAVLTRDGQSSPTGNLPMAGFRFTGAGQAVSDRDFVTLDQAFPKRSVLQAVDWNLLTNSGFYETTANSFNAGAGAGNFPAGAGNGVLCVYGVAGGAIICQEYLTASQRYTRMRVSGSWSAWSAVVPAGSILTSMLADGLLTADAAGRAKMVDGFVTLAKLANGILSADAAGRAKMADKFITLAKLADELTLPLSQGGTGATTAAAARTNLEVPKRDGTDAAGNWGINASSATKLSNDLGSAPSYGVRGFCNFDGSGTTGANQTIRRQGNISSILKNGSGDYTATFTTPMPDTNYLLIGQAQDNLGGSYFLKVLGPAVGAPTLKTTTQIRFGWGGAGGSADNSNIHFIII